MADKATKTTKKNLYKAVEPTRFKEERSDSVPFYKELSNGESVALDLNNKHVKAWISNNVVTLDKKEK